jgi:hypothetical protein
MARGKHQRRAQVLQMRGPLEAADYLCMIFCWVRAVGLCKALTEPRLQVGRCRLIVAKRYSRGRDGHCRPVCINIPP